MTEIKKINLKISGMHCAGCATGIESGLTRTQGIKKAQVNFATTTASVEFDSEQTDKLRILDDIAKLGYGAEESVESGAQFRPEFSRAGQNFLFALALTIPIMVVSMKEMLAVNLPIANSVAGIILIILTLPVMLFPGREIFIDAFRQLRHFRANMNSLIALGSLSAFLYSSWLTMESLIYSREVAGFFYFETTAMIITLILLGRYLENRAKEKARDAIGALLRLRPEKAIAIINGEEMEIDISAVRPDMILLVRPGDKIPADGKIIEGEPSIDESMITGESVPVDKTVGNEVIGGSVNGSRSFKFLVTGTGENSFLAGVVRLISEAQNRKAPVQKLADRISSIFVPIVLLISILTFIIWFVFDRQSPMLVTAPIAVLIIACPCALGLATPTAILTGTGWAARRGIYIRGGDVLENVVGTDHVIFDKTGTLTEGHFKVISKRSVLGVEGEAHEIKMLQMAASAESGSNHPLARAIVEEAHKLDLKLWPASELVESPGFGLRASVADKIVLVGNDATMKKENIEISMLLDESQRAMDLGHTIVYVAVDGKALGFLALADKIRDEAPQVLNNLSQSGRKVVILTGDNFQTARGVARALGVGHFEAGIKPSQKSLIVETYRRAGNKVMMVGDGINDAPALAAADIGVALGSGTDVAIESADIILVRNDLSSLLEAFNISRLTYRTIKQNLFWAFSYNVIAIPLAAGLIYPVLGWSLSPVVAAAAMAFSSLFVVSNSLRLLRTEKG